MKNLKKLRMETLNTDQQPLQFATELQQNVGLQKFNPGQKLKCWAEKHNPCDPKSNPWNLQTNLPFVLKIKQTKQFYDQFGSIMHGECTKYSRVQRSARELTYCCFHCNFWDAVWGECVCMYFRLIDAKCLDSLKRETVKCLKIISPFF